MTIQQQLSDACVTDLRKYGDSFKGVGYTKSADDAQRCYAVMLGVLRQSSVPATIIDLGCGLAHLLEHINRSRLAELEYTGIDLSEEYLTACRAKYPNNQFIQADVLSTPSSLPEADYIVMNGVFNYRGEIERDQMVRYFKSMVALAYSKCRIGIAFNVMSKRVDWERDDLFHVSFDEMTSWLCAEVSRHFCMRQDYGMYEYTTYVYRAPLVAA